HDPLDVSAAERESRKGPGWLTDQGDALRSSGGELFYHTPPFEQDTDIAGFFSLSAWIELDQPDTDITVSVGEVKPDGSFVMLSGSALRARYRHDLRKPQPVRPGAIERYDFDEFMFVARRIGKGSRLRL